MELPVAAERLLVGVNATLSVQLVDYQGEAAAPTGTLTVDITRADGTALVTGGSTSGSGSNPRTYVLAAANNTELDHLSAAWKDAGTTRLTTDHEIVGGFYFSLAELEAFDSSLGDLHTSSTNAAKARRIRNEVERECERITGVAWVPRYARIRVDGSGTPRLDLRQELYAPRVLRSARLYTDGTNYTALTTSELANVELVENGVLVRRDGLTWPSGYLNLAQSARDSVFGAGKNILLEVEYGYDRPPEDLRHAAMTRFRQRWNMEKTPVMTENAQSWTLPGGAIELPPADVEIAAPEVFRIYKQYSKRIPGLA